MPYRAASSKSRRIITAPRAFLRALAFSQLAYIDRRRHAIRIYYLYCSAPYTVSCAYIPLDIIHGQRLLQYFSVTAAFVATAIYMPRLINIERRAYRFNVLRRELDADFTPIFLLIYDASAKAAAAFQRNFLHDVAHYLI